jgi:hypothetical protein
MAAHTASCTSCSEAVASDRAMALLAVVDDAGSFPSAAALRLEGELLSEERRLARRVHVLVALHAGALAVSLALLATVRLVELRADARASTWGGAGSVCALVVVAISIWNLFRSADESAVPS